MTKTELRTIFREKRASLSSDERQAKSRDIAMGFFDTFDLTTVTVLDVFIPILKLYEVNTSLIYKAIWRSFPNIVTTAPRIDHDNGQLDHLAFNGDTAFVVNKWGISEPISDIRISESAIDMTLIPLLCFDLSGHRVGYGKGFYDRFLARCRADVQKVGLAYFGPVERIEDIDAFDVRIDHVVTPDEVYDFSN
jgi:5-formyltetrahydrofolate cyclo-ligase